MADDQFDFPVPNFARPLNNWLGVANPPPPSPQGPPSWRQAIAENKRTQARKPPVGETLADIIGKTGQFAAGVATAPINMVSGLYGKVAAANEAARNPSLSSDVYADQNAMAKDTDVPATALGLMGAGVPFAKPGALGSAGGKAVAAETGEGQTLGDIIRAYHGSPQTELNVIKAAPETRQFDNATSQFGAYFAPNAKAAERYAGQTGRIYAADLVDILKKYGIAGLSALPAMGAYHFQNSDIGKQ